MSFRDWTQHLLGRLGQGEMSTVLPNGGTSCYRPNQKKKKDEQPEEPATIHTGFTGMMPPAEDAGNMGWGAYPQNGYPQAGYPQDSYQQGGYQQTGYQQTGYRQTGYQQTGYQQTGYQQTGYQQAVENRADASRSGMTGEWSIGGNERSDGNIVYMPGSALVGQPAHVERILTLTSLQGCYEAIDSMRDGESLIVLMDTIANDAEILRCQDMLMGAAFTLGCGVRQLQGNLLLLITPPGVVVLPEEKEYRQIGYEGETVHGAWA